MTDPKAPVGIRSGIADIFARVNRNLNKAESEAFADEVLALITPAPEGEYVRVPRKFLEEVSQAANGEGPAHKWREDSDADALDYLGIEADKLLSAAPPTPTFDEARAREILAAELRKMGWAHISSLADRVAAGDPCHNTEAFAALAAIRSYALGKEG